MPLSDKHLAILREIQIEWDRAAEQFMVDAVSVPVIAASHNGMVAETASYFRGN